MAAALAVTVCTPANAGTTAQVEVRLSAGNNASSIADGLRATLGARFGGAWLSADGHLEVGVADPAEAARVRAAGAVAVPVTYPEQQLDQAKAKLDADHQAAPDTVQGWYVDLPTNSVVLLSPPEQIPAARRFVAANDVDAVVRVVASTGQARELDDLNGGDGIFVGKGSCTAGFAIDAVMEPPTMRAGFVTAGHCGYLGGGSPLLGPNGGFLGWWGGVAFPGADMAWIRTSDPWTPQPFVDGLGQVGGSQEALVGATVCKSGAKTGVTCGVIKSKNVTRHYEDKYWVYGLTSTTACSQPGDSGSPFMAGDQAQGILSGADDKGCAAGGLSYFQPINPVLDKFHLKLRTTTWTGWLPLPAADGATVTSPAAAMYGTTEYVVIRDLFGHLRFNTLTANGVWGKWRPVPGDRTTPSAPAVVAYNGALTLVIRGADDLLYSDSLTGSTWSGWQPVPGNLPTKSAPAVTTLGGVLWLFLRDNKDLLYQQTLFGTHWTGWSPVPGNGSTDDSPAAADVSGKVLLMAHAVGGRIYTDTFTDGGWQGWSAVPTGTTVRPLSAAVQEGAMTLFARGGDKENEPGKVYFNQGNGSSWLGWAQVGGGADFLTSSGPAADYDAPAAALHVYAQGTDNRVYINVRK